MKNYSYFDMQLIFLVMLVFIHLGWYINTICTDEAMIGLDIGPDGLMFDLILLVLDLF